MEDQMDESRRVIEINGVKFEVDLRSAKRIDEVRCGDRVKVLIKSYGDSYKVCIGVVVGFTPFEQLPTITIAYFESDYSATNMKILNFNASSKDIEVCVATDDDAVESSKADALRAFDRKIEQAEATVRDAQEQRAYFLRNFGKWWSEIAPVEEKAEQA